MAFKIIKNSEKFLLFATVRSEKSLNKANNENEVSEKGRNIYFGLKFLLNF